MNAGALIQSQPKSAADFYPKRENLYFCLTMTLEANLTSSQIAHKRVMAAKWRSENRAKSNEISKAARAKRPRSEINAWQREYRKRNAEKRRAWERIQYRVQTKHTWPGPSLFLCSDCSLPAEHYHHEDYSLWWSVEPLCRICHMKRHHSEVEAA